MEIEEDVKEKYYNRGIFILGEEGMENLCNSEILVIGLSSVGIEICKNKNKNEKARTW